MLGIPRGSGTNKQMAYSIIPKHFIENIEHLDLDPTDEGHKD